MQVKIGATDTRESLQYTVLLAALDNPDDAAREAHNYMLRREPWMTSWLLERFDKTPGNLARKSVSPKEVRKSPESLKSGPIHRFPLINPGNMG